MEKYKEFVYYRTTKSDKKQESRSVLKPALLLIAVFGSLSILGLIGSRGIVIVILINIISITLVFISQYQMKKKELEDRYLGAALLLLALSLCFSGSYGCILIIYEQIPLFRGLICVSGMQMIIISIGIYLGFALFVLLLTKKKINSRWYKSREVKAGKQLSKSTIISLGVIGSVVAMNAKGGALAIIAFFTLIGIAEYYMVQCFMRYYYVKKYSLADAINMVEKAP